MEGKTIKTLVEYIAELRERDKTLLNPENYRHAEVDTNGVTADVDSNHDVHSRAH